MKKIALILFCNVLLITNIINAQQNVGFGTSTPHPSALLDMTSTNKGLLIPRVTLVALNNGTTPVNAPATGLLVYNSAGSLTKGFYYWDGTQWVMVGAGSSDCETLEEAYNCGGAGAGRTINADYGPVEIKLNSGTINKALLVTNNRPNSFAIEALTTVAGVAIRGINTLASNPFPTIQAETNSTATDNAAITGSNTGAGYGVGGQIPATSNGKAGIYGNNLRTTADTYGVLGMGHIGVYGSTNYGLAGVYGNNSQTTPNTVGIWGNGWVGVCGETNAIDGWSGYFMTDVCINGYGIASSWGTFSDKRLKSNIQPIPNALQKISQISGNTYILKTPTRDAKGNITTKERVQYGVIAQEVEPIFPEIVSEKAIFNNLGDETVYKTVNYDGLIPVLIEAVKELKAEVDALKKEIEELKK